MQNDGLKKKDQPLKKFENIFNLFMVLFVSIILLIIFEVSSFFIINKRNFYLPLNLNKSHEIKTKKGSLIKYNLFSFELGWNSPMDLISNKHGYIGHPRDMSSAFLCLFGDSFTEGLAATPYEESWPVLLEKKLGRPVLNFGSGGYGTDQAYWIFEKKYIGKIKTPYVFLGIMSENIARNMNRYRGFYVRGTEIGMTKPMYYKEKNGKISLLENPLKTPDDFELLNNNDFLRQIGEKDFWYNYFEHFGFNKKVHFPYSYFFIKAIPFYISQIYETKIMNRSAYFKLYNNTDALSVMEHIIFKFISKAEDNATIPIILFFPSDKDLAYYKKAGETVYYKFYQSIKNKYDFTFDAMNYFAPYVEKGEDISSFFKNSHYNTCGSRIVANGFYEDIIALEKSIKR